MVACGYVSNRCIQCFRFLSLSHASGKLTPGPTHPGTSIQDVCEAGFFLDESVYSVKNLKPFANKKVYISGPFLSENRHKNLKDSAN